MGSLNFIRRASGFYTPAIIGLAAVPWQFTPCPDCCGFICIACQDGTSHGAFNLTLDGFIDFGFDDCAILNDSYVLTEKIPESCTYNVTVPIYFGFSWGTLSTTFYFAIVHSSWLQVHITNTTMGTVARYRLSTGFDAEGRWDCDFVDQGIPWITGMPCGSSSTASITAL